LAGTGRERNPNAIAPVPIWSLPEHGERGPKPRHSRAAIAAVAVRIADAEGIDAVTMRRIAGDLGVGTMSLYNYVPTKDHVVQLMIDQIAGEHTYPRRPPRDMRSAVADLARQGRDITQRHPWLPGVMHRPPAIGPNALRYVDHFLGLLADSGLDAGAKMVLIALINGFAISYGGTQAALAEERVRTGISAEDQAAVQITALTVAAASGRYPNLAAALAAPGSPPQDADALFESCVLRILDGALAG
jgi:AcrR family transcriptional regulator